MSEKWLAIMMVGLFAFGIAVPISVEKWQEGQTERAKIQLEIEQLRASGNVGK
jgi:hypothetical protein